MSQHAWRFSLIAVFVLFWMVVPANDAVAQCSVTSTYQGNFTTMGMSANYVSKYLSTSYTCSLTMSMNVFNCYPSGAGTYTSILYASAYTTATNPSCGWTCDCGPVTIDGSDGLPVELMDFAVE